MFSALEVVRLGGRVTTLNISQRQLDLARKRFAETGVADRTGALYRRISSTTQCSKTASLT